MNHPTCFSDKSPSSGTHQYNAINKTITSVLHVHCLVLKILGNIFMSLEDTSNDILFKFVYFLNFVLDAWICDADAESTPVPYGSWNDVCWYSLEKYVALLLYLSSQQKWCPTIAQYIHQDDVT